MYPLHAHSLRGCRLLYEVDIVSIAQTAIEILLFHNWRFMFQKKYINFYSY